MYDMKEIERGLRRFTMTPALTPDTSTNRARLKPIPWGTPDPALARAICREWLPSMMPSTPWQHNGPSMGDHLRGWCGWCIVATVAMMALAYAAR